MKKINLFITLIMTIMSFTMILASPLKIVTSTPDLADLARQIGGDKVVVVSLSNGTQDPHHIEPRPSMVNKVGSADLAIKIGMELDSWCDSIIEVAKSRNIAHGRKGLLDASEGIIKLEIPKGKIDGSMGDIHQFGNPHYLLNPENGRILIGKIKARLSELDPKNEAYFQANYNHYDRQLQAHIARWKAQLEKLQATPMASFHPSLPYFGQAFGLKLVATVEEKPGMSPSPRYLMALEEKIRRSKIKLIMTEPWQDQSVLRSLSQRTGVKVVTFSPCPGAIAGVNSYIGMFDYTVNALLSAGEN